MFEILVGLGLIKYKVPVSLNKTIAVRFSEIWRKFFFLIVIVFLSGYQIIARRFLILVFFCTIGNYSLK